MDGQSGSPESLPRNSNNSISAAKLLKNIEKSYDKGKKLLDESSSGLEDSDVRFRSEDGKVLFGMNAEEYYNTVILYERNERYKIYHKTMNEEQKQMLAIVSNRVLKRLNGKKVPRLTLAKMVNEETEKLMQQKKMEQ